MLAQLDALHAAIVTFDAEHPEEWSGELKPHFCALGAFADVMSDVRREWLERMEPRP